MASEKSFFRRREIPIHPETTAQSSRVEPPVVQGLQVLQATEKRAPWTPARSQRAMSLQPPRMPIHTEAGRDDEGKRGEEILNPLSPRAKKNNLSCDDGI